MLSLHMKRYIWRYFFVMIVLFFTVYTDYSLYNDITTLDFITLQLNDALCICFYLLYTYNLIIGDINANGNQIDAWLRIATSAIIIIAIYIVCCNGVYLLHEKHLDYNGTSVVNTLYGLNPVIATLQSIILVYFRLVFIGGIVLVFNSLWNAPVGILFSSMVTVFDWWFYDLMNIPSPLGITPLEHTRLFFTEAMAPAGADVSRTTSPFISILVWICLIAILVAIMHFVNRANNSSPRKTCDTRIFRYLKSAWFPIVLIMLLSCLTYQHNELLLNIDQNAGSLTRFIFGCTYENQFLILFAPFIAAFSGTILQTGNKQIIGNAWREYILGGLSLFVGLTLCFLLCVLIWPQTDLLENKYLMYSIMQPLYSFSPYGYCATFLLYAGVFGFIFSLFSYALFCITKSAYYAFALPSLIYYMASLIVAPLPETLRNILYYFVPFLTFDLNSGVELSYFITQMTFTLLVSLALLITNKKRQRIGGKY